MTDNAIDLNGPIEVTGSFLTNDGTRNRIVANATDSRIVSANGTNSVVVNDTYTNVTGSFGVTVGATERIGIDATTTLLYSPDDTQSIVLSDAGLSYQDGAQSRLAVNSSTSELVSPDGNTKIDVDNADVHVTGDFSVNGDVDLSNNVTIGSSGDMSYLHLARGSGDYIGTPIVFDATGNGSGGVYSVFVMDSFWGMMRHYGSFATDITYVYQNVGAGGVDFIIEGDQLLQGNDGFDAGGETAQLTLGDADNYIRAGYAAPMIIHGYSGVQFSDITTDDYFILDQGKIIMNKLPTSDPATTGELWNDNGFLKISSP
jgi:hypothetical protein